MRRDGCVCRPDRSPYFGEPGPIVENYDVGARHARPRRVRSRTVGGTMVAVPNLVLRLGREC